MKFQAKSIEYWCRDAVETVFFGNEEGALALILSAEPGTTRHYLEWQSPATAIYDGVRRIYFNDGKLHIDLLPDAAEQVGEREFEIVVDDNDHQLDQVILCLERIFQEKFSYGSLSSGTKSISTTNQSTKNRSTKNFEAIRYLDLEGKNLRALPDDIARMTTLEVVKFAHNPIEDLDAALESLAGCPRLRELSFSLVGGPIPERLGKLTQLEALSITELERPCRFPESIGQLKRLRSLFVMSDSEVHLPESFADLSELQQLQLRVTGWNLPREIYKLSKLTELDLTHCRATEFPVEIASMTNIEAIIIDRSELPAMSLVMPILASMPHLKRLEVNWNPLPREIGLCRNIEELIVSVGTSPADPLQLPEELFELVQLQTLLLHRNYFEEIPNGLGKLRGLTALSFQESVFETLPDSIGELSNLEFLNLSDNPSLQKLPASMGNLTKLQTLLLNDTPRLKELPFSFENLHRLEQVRLSHEPPKNVPKAWLDLIQ